jgi:hypothetical protein
MRNLRFISGGLITALALSLATPALAGDEERARAAIAEAQGKIDAATRIDADSQSPDVVARAQAALRLAQEELKSGHEQKAIQAAIAAQQAADSAIGRSKQARADEAANTGASLAQAQQQAADAQARAQAAEQAAAAAQADAAAARAAPPVVVASAAPPTTTVVTETTKAVATPAKSTRAAPRKTVKRTTVARSTPRTTETTRTTVTTSSN